MNAVNDSLSVLITQILFKPILLNVRLGVTAILVNSCPKLEENILYIYFLPRGTTQALVGENVIPYLDTYMNIYLLKGTEPLNVICSEPEG